MSLAARLRVPAVYLTWANQVFLAFFAFNGINNLGAFSVAFSSIPTAPTNLLSFQRVESSFLFQSEHLFQLTASQCAPLSRAAIAE